jgi:hypothetical protein
VPSRRRPAPGALATRLAQVKHFSLIELAGCAAIFTCMILMRFGL